MQDSSTPTEIRSFANDIQRLTADRSGSGKSNVLARLAASAVQLAQAEAQADTSSFHAGESERYDECTPGSGVVILELVAELLFVRQLHPVHRQLLAALRSLPPRHLEAFQRRLAALAQQHAAECTAAGAPGGDDQQGTAWCEALQLAQPVNSLLAFHEHHAAVQRCAAPVLGCLAAALSYFSEDNSHGESKHNAGNNGSSKAAAVEIDDVNEAVSAAYSLLSQFGREMVGDERGDGGNAVVAVAEALLTTLQVSRLVLSLTRDSYVIIFAPLAGDQEAYFQAWLKTDSAFKHVATIAAGRAAQRYAVLCRHGAVRCICSARPACVCCGAASVSGTAGGRDSSKALAAGWQDYCFPRGSTPIGQCSGEGIAGAGHELRGGVAQLDASCSAIYAWRHAEEHAAQCTLCSDAAGSRR